jgi:hypothetical protein
MSVCKLFGAWALFLLAACMAIQAQTPARPGELPKPSSAPSLLSSLGSGAGFSSVLPRNDIAKTEDSHDKVIRRVWVASIVAMVAGTTADAVSSWHKRESNGLLASSDGVFGPKGVALKAGIAAAILTPQIILRKHRDWHAAFAVGNFAEAGIFAGATIHNASLK